MMTSLRPKYPLFSVVAFAAVLFGVSLSASEARAARAAQPFEEQKAQWLQDIFEEDFELNFDQDAAYSGTEPNWYKLLRPTMKVRRSGKTPARTFVPKVGYGVMFTGPSKYSEGATDLIAPASTSKIFTVSLALKELGGDYTYTTRFTWKKSTRSDGVKDLKVFTSGDPSITTGTIGAIEDKLVAEFTAAGVKSVYGDAEVIPSDPRWADRTIPAGWRPDDSITNVPGVLNTVKVETFKAGLLKRLKKAGIKWETKSPAPFTDEMDVEMVHTSAPFRELIKPFMFDSINYMGEGILRKVGELKGAKSASNLLEAALPLLNDFATKHIGPNRVSLNDGCGLSRTSRVSAAALITFMNEMKQEPFFADFIASFPTAGQSGTLENRMKNTAAVGLVHGKTGTLFKPVGNFQLAGFVQDKRKTGTEYHPFAILTETSEATSSYCRLTQDFVMARFAEWMIENQ